MPRKKNGLGNFSSFGVKGFDSKTSKAKAIGAAGTYPGNRQFGSSVHRTVIEKYDIDSDWTRWRKGIEYYYQGAYLDYEDIETILYQGTRDEVEVLFDSKQYATTNSDSRSHYTARRTMVTNKELGVITDIHNDANLYSDNFDRNELWVKVEHSDVDLTSKLRRTVGERITDGVTSANVINVLTKDKLPSIYTGKTSSEEKIQITVSIPVDELMETDFIKGNRGDLNSLIGEIGYFPQFLQERNLNGSEVFDDGAEYFTVLVDDDLIGNTFEILDNTTDLPPALLDISNLNSVYSSQECPSRITGKFTFKKADYQRFFKQQYLTADVVKDKVSQICYATMPFQIKSVLLKGDGSAPAAYTQAVLDEDLLDSDEYYTQAIMNMSLDSEELNNYTPAEVGEEGEYKVRILELTAEPQQGTIKLFTPGELENYLIIADNSFTKLVLDCDADGNYLHDPPAPNERPWHRLITDIDPWYDSIFTTGQQLTFAEVYCCSCPDFSHAVIRMPESTGDDGKPGNRQRKFPLPSAMGTPSFDQSGLLEAAGVVQSWETNKYKTSFRLCKHTVSTMFINKIKVQEPKSYPSIDSRIKFEQRLAKDMEEVASEFRAQMRRSNITTAEVIFMLSQGLNLDDIETAYVMLNSKF